MNEVKKIKAKLKPDEVTKFKSVLKVLKYTSSGIKIDNLLFEDKSDHVEVSFESDHESYNSIVQKLALNSIELEVTDEETEKIVTDANKQIERSKNKNKLLSWNEEGKNDHKTKIEEIKIEEKTTYTELINIIRDVRANKEVINEAKSKLDLKINSAIEKAYKPAMQDEYYASIGLKNLIQICTDKKLELVSKKEFKTRAGVLAINICLKYDNFQKTLIEISNNRNIENLINVTAAVRIAEKLNKTMFATSKLSQYVLKDLNTKWVETRYSVVKEKFEEREKELFDKLLKFVREKR